MMKSNRKKPLMNLSDVEMKRRSAEDGPPSGAHRTYGLSRGSVGSHIGAELLGYNISSLPPGCRGYPRHNHHVNEEMFLILSGEGELIVGEQIYPVTTNDIIACPPGGPETAHQLVNTGKEELKFLAVSTQLSPEFVEYPDSGKFGVYARRNERAGAGESKPERFSFLGREGEGCDYWDGE